MHQSRPEMLCLSAHSPRRDYPRRFARPPEHKITGIESKCLLSGELGVMTLDAHTRATATMAARASGFGHGDESHCGKSGHEKSWARHALTHKFKNGDVSTVQEQARRHRRRPRQRNAVPGGIKAYPDPSGPPLGPQFLQAYFPSAVVSFDPHLICVFTAPFPEYFNQLAFFGHSIRACSSASPGASRAGCIRRPTLHWELIQPLAVS
jgi:hypothetical protein